MLPFVMPMVLYYRYDVPLCFVIRFFHVGELCNTGHYSEHNDFQEGKNAYEEGKIREEEEGMKKESRGKEREEDASHNCSHLAYFSVTNSI